MFQVKRAKTIDSHVGCNVGHFSSCRDKLALNKRANTAWGLKILCTKQMGKSNVVTGMDVIFHSVLIWKCDCSLKWPLWCPSTVIIIFHHLTSVSKPPLDWTWTYIFFLFLSFSTFKIWWPAACGSLNIQLFQSFVMMT